MKIAILGTSGSGKSTLAKRLGERYGLPVLHMDTVHFLPGWVERPFAEEEAIVRQFLDENAGGWVIDGNYTKTCYARRLEEADKIIVLWFSPLVCLWRAVRRWQQNKGRVRESSAPGCEEKIDAEFVRWILHDGRTKQKWAQMERIGEKYPENYILIRNQRELDKFLERRGGFIRLAGALARGVLYAEGSRRYLEALSTYTRRRMTQAAKAQVDEVLYVPAALALHQRPGVPGIRSTFGTSWGWTAAPPWI